MFPGPNYAAYDIILSDCLLTRKADFLRKGVKNMPPAGLECSQPTGFNVWRAGAKSPSKEISGPEDQITLCHNDQASVVHRRGLLGGLRVETKFTVMTKGGEENLVVRRLGDVEIANAGIRLRQEDPLLKFDFSERAPTKELARRYSQVNFINGVSCAIFYVEEPPFSWKV